MKEDLLNLDFTRINIVMLFIVPAIINLLIACYVHIVFNKRSTDRMFMLFVLGLGVWQLIDGFVHLARTRETALEWNGLGGPVLVFAAVTGMLFMLLLTGWYNKTSLKTRFLLITLPSIVIALVIFLRMDTYTVIESNQWYWIINPQTTIITGIVLAWFMVIGLGIVLIPLLFYFRGEGSSFQKKQALFLSLGFCVPLIVGSMSEIILPLAFSTNNVPLTNPMITAFSLTTFFAIKKYRLFDYSPKHQWESIIESINDGLVIVNNRDEIMYANNAFCSLLEYELREIKGKMAKELFLAEESEKRMVENINEQRKQKLSSQYELQMKTKSGRKIWTLMSGAPYLDDNGNVVGSICIQTDINELKEKQARLNRAIEAGRMVTIDNNYSANTTTLSGNAKEILGIETCNTKFSDLLQLVHPDDCDMFKKTYENMLNTKVSNDIEFRIIHPLTNETIWLEKRCDLIFDTNGNILGSTGLLIDITRKKQTDSERTTLSKELQDYRYALEESSIVAVTDHMGKIKYVNDNFCNISKYTREELVGQDHCILNSGHHSKDFFRSLWLTISAGRVWRGEIRNKAKDGSFYWVDTTIVPFINGNKKPYQYVAIRTDITNRKEFEEKLEKTKSGLEISERMHKEAQAIAHFGNWELDFATGVALWSEEACRIYGLDPNDNIHRYEDWLSFIHPQDLATVLELSKQGQATLSKASFPHRIVWRNGTVRHIHSISQFKFDAQGKPIGMYGVAHDITGQTETEEKLKAANHELQTFIYRASHDMRGPLASIIGLTNISKKDVSDEKALKYLDMISGSTQKLDGILKSLVQTMNIKDTTEFVDEIDFNKLIAERLESLEHYQGFSNMSITKSVNVFHPFRSNKSILESTLQNLIENAIKFRNLTNPNQKLNISVQEKGKEIAIVVEDNGIGIPAELQPKVFDMYFRASGEISGSGLGLYLVKTGVEKLGGRIELASKEKVETRFTIRLPMVA